MSNRKFYSSHRNTDLINQATIRLLEIKIKDLLEDIYDTQNDSGIFGHPEVRIGLSLKLLHNLRVSLDKSIIQPIIDDIENLMESPEYLESTGDSERRLKCLQDELDFVHRYIDLDDSITLNTINQPISTRRPRASHSSQTSNSNDSNPYRRGMNAKQINQDENACVIV
tara:strand:+ start:1315 stop:1821 length:507 start_codon:yes stop_codon:yes gene_type:complete